MKPAIKSNIVFFSLCITSIFLTSACSQNIQETNKYYNPAWMADGKIICVHSYEKVAIGSSSSGIYGSSGGTILAQNNYLTVINPTTNTEQNILDLPWGSYPKLNCSPKGAYVAVTNYNGLDIYQLSNMQKINTIAVNERILSFDWSPDEINIVTQELNGNVYIYNLDGTKIRSLDILVPNWKYSEYIIGYENNSSSADVIILNTNNEIIERANKKYIYSGEFFPNENAYFGLFAKIKIPSFNIIETYNNLKTELKKENGFIISINPSKPNEVMYCTNFDVNPNYYNNFSIINLDGTNRRNIR